MLRVALTGGIASGKSTVARILEQFGAQVSQSDEVARSMMQPGAPVFATIVATFGDRVVRPDGQLDRAVLARLAFAEGRLNELSALVHPAVITAQAHWMEQVEQRAPEAIAIVESALVLETPHVPNDGIAAPWRTRFDRVVVVSAAVHLRQERYLARLSSSVKPAEATRDFQQRAAAQWSDEEREVLADYILRNSGSLSDLQDKVAKLYDSLRTEAADRNNEAM